MFIGVDLGSTNLKAALYNEAMHLLDRRSLPVSYIRENGFVEFDPESYFQDLISLLTALLSENDVSSVAQIAFTGQAESLVCVDARGNTLMNAISWMDERSTEECQQLSALFPQALCESVTGQQAVLPTWPATKILWLKRHRPEVFSKTATFMLLKDYIIYRLTEKKLADMSIATFSFYFDIYEKTYWQPMLDAIGITTSQLPPLAEPCTVAGPLTPEIAARLGVSGQCLVNIGTLDHFAGMIGTGNVTFGGVTLSTGTVMALSAMACQPAPRNSGIAMHYGFMPDTHIMLPVSESGGASLEWFRRSCMANVSYDEINQVLAQREKTDLLFLPYLVGTNAPEFDSNATGVFWGLRQEHDAYDMAYAVMEGVAFLLKKNCDAIVSSGTPVSHIIATGGGAKSPIWCQLQADITGVPVTVPAETEAACLGAAIIAAVSAGRYPDYSAAAQACVQIKTRFVPQSGTETAQKYKKFCALYKASLEISKMA